MHKSRRCLIIAFAFILLFTGCHRNAAPRSIVARMVEPRMRIDWPVYYYETTDGRTAVYRIVHSTDDINSLLWNLDGVLAMDCSENAIYLLRENLDGCLYLTRLEKDSRRTTDAELPVEIVADRDRPWSVSPSDAVAVSGKDVNGTGYIFVSTWVRTEPEETFRQDVVGEPTITHDDVQWYTGQGDIGQMALSNGGSRLAFAMTLDGEQDLYYTDGPDLAPERIGERPVVDLGGFSPDDSMIAATFSLEDRVDVFLADTETLEARPITRVARGFTTSDPAWHPIDNYLFYTTDYTTEFVTGTTPLSGEQLFIYHVPSGNTRRLTSFEDTDLWVDFAPNGDFFLYSSIEGVLGGRGRALPSRNPEAVEEEREKLETWRMFYIPWDREEFLTSESTTLVPENLLLFVSWTVGGDGEISFAWGPELNNT
jgi:hypothetical protein